MIGSMRERITLKQPVNTMVEGGGHITTWVLFENEWAKVEPVKSLYGLQDSQYKLQDALRFTIRSIFSFSPTWLIQYRGRDYTISSIKNINQRDRFQEVIAITNNDSPTPITT